MKKPIACGHALFRRIWPALISLESRVPVSLSGWIHGGKVGLEMKSAQWSFLMFAVIGLLPCPSQSQQGQSTNPTIYHDLREALNALKTTKDKDEKQRIYQNFQNVPVRDHDDLMALYQETKTRQDGTPLLASDKDFDEYVRNGQTIAARLKGCTDAAFQDDIATLIDQEAKSISEDSETPMLPLGKLSLQAGAKSTLRIARVQALFNAAGDGKNAKARDALWRVIDSAQDAYFGQLAVAALGKIGNTQDLNRLIQLVEEKPQLHLEFTDFGSAAIPRLVDEIKNRNLPKDTQGRLSLGLGQVASHDTISAYVLLMHDSNQFVAKQAQLAVEHNLRNTDEDLIRRMLNDPSDEVRAKAMIAIDGHAWDSKFVPLLIGILKNDSNLKTVAARCLGHHKVQDAVPALHDALKDSHPHVRHAAEEALRGINGK